MKVSATHIASLSKLHLSEEEQKTFQNDLDAVLKAFKVLDELDVSNTKSSFQPITQRNVMRDDKVEDCFTQEQALSFAQDKEKGFFIGPKTLE